MKLGLAFSIIVAILLISAVVFSTNFIPSQDKVFTKDKLEAFLKRNNADEEIARAYRFAYENPQGVLSKVKCYCGCITNQGHKNNRNCFFDDNGGIDLMGLNCGLCIKTALLSKQMLAEGKTTGEIASSVDNKWGNLAK